VPQLTSDVPSCLILKEMVFVVSALRLHGLCNSARYSNCAKTFPIEIEFERTLKRCTKFSSVIIYFTLFISAYYSVPSNTFIFEFKIISLYAYASSSPHSLTTNENTSLLINLNDFGFS